MHFVFLTIMSKEVALSNKLKVQFEKKTDPVGPCTAWSQSISSASSTSSSIAVHQLSLDDCIFDDEEITLNGEVHVGTQEELDQWDQHSESESDEDDDVVEEMNMKKSDMAITADSDCESDVTYEGPHESSFHGSKMSSEEELDHDSDDAMDALDEYYDEHARVDADGNKEVNCFDCFSVFW